MMNGMVIHNTDLFAGLPILIETKRAIATWHVLFYDWFTPFSMPIPVGDATFFEVVHALLYLLIGDVILSYKLYVILLLAVSFFSMYVLSYSLADKNKVLSAVLSATFFTLTPYFLLELTGHLYMMWSYALLPITYYFIYRALNDGGKRTYTWTCIAGIFIALSAFYPMTEYIYTNGIFLVLFSLLFCFKGVNRTQLKLLAHKIFRVVIMFSIALLLSVYFLFPMFFLTSPYSASFAFSRTLAYPIYSNTYIESSFLLNKGFSADLGLNYFNIFGALMIPFVLPIILSSLLITIKRKYVYLVFFLLGLLGVFFSMGSNAPPFLRFFEYARFLPSFSSDRTPCRFTDQVASSFSLLGGIAVGVGLDSLSKLGPRLGKALAHNYKPKVLGLLLFSAVIIPYLFSGIIIAYSVAGPFQTQPMPAYVSKVVSWLDEHDPNQDYRVIDLTNASLVGAYHRSLQIDGDDLVARFYRSPSFATILGMLNVKYIITDPDWGEPYFYWHSDINKVLSSSPNFDKVQIDNETIYINKLAEPEVYASNGALVVGGPSALSTFYAAIDEAQLANTAPSVSDNLTLNSGWAAAEVVNTASYGFETQNGTADLWINTTQAWPAYVGYNYDNLNINPNDTRYLIIRLKNDENPASATSVHLFDDLNDRLVVVENVHFSNWTTLTIDLSAYTQRPIKRILIYTVETSNVTGVQLHTYIDSVAFINEPSQQGISNSDWALFGTDVLTEENNLNQTGNFNAIVFQDSDLMDLVFQQLDPAFKLEAWKYLNGKWSIVEDQHGDVIPSAESYQSSVAGQLVLSERAIYTDKNATLVVPFSVNKTGSYDVWVRAANTVPIDWCKWEGPLPPTTNVISTTIDGSTVGQADFGKVGGFKWIKINNAPLSLSQGSHTLNLFTSGNPIYLDMIAVTPAGLVDSAVKKEMADISDLQQMYLLEFSNYFTGENAVRDASVVPYTSDAWSGYLTLEPNATIMQNLYIAKNDTYVLDLRLLQRLDSGILTLKIDGTTVLSAFERGNNSWAWISPDTIYLSAGEHEIEVTSEKGYNSIDLMSLIEQPLMSNLAVEPGQVQYNQVQLDTWRGNMSFSKPAFVVFTESYYPEWVFQQQTGTSLTSIGSLEAFYFLNAYHINSAGVIQFTLHHELSQVRSISFALSIATFGFCIIVIVAETMPRKLKFGFRRQFQIRCKINFERGGEY
jgi:accessory gene regulator protein AgrB